VGAPGWQAECLPWEMRLLEDLGCALDRPSCAVTGAREGLACVRPKPGRAGCRAGAGDWAEKLFPLPEGMAGGPMTPAALLQGLAITSHFLARELAEDHHGRPLPEARGRLLDLLARAAEAS